MMLNNGGWGRKWTLDPSGFVPKGRMMEEKGRPWSGMKWLYADVYQLEADFWAGYDGRGWYDELRAKYHPASFPTVHEKVHG